MKNKNYKILFLGPQGSGKGTQAQMLVEKLNIPYFSTGNILRQRIQNPDEFGIELAGIINSGQLVSDELVNKIVAEKVKQPESQKGYVLDGYPRNLSQAEFFDQQDELTHVLFINISDQEAIRRVGGRRTCPQCQKVYHMEYNPPKQDEKCDICQVDLVVRDDETESALKKRLAIYHELTEPIIDHYRKKGILIEIDGEQPIEKVHQDILQSMNIE